MEKVFKVDIFTSNKTLFSGEVSSLVAPGELGYLGVLANHAPLITNLIPGKITLKMDSGKPATIYSKGKGFLEVADNTATLLLDDA